MESTSVKEGAADAARVKEGAFKNKADIVREGAVKIKADRVKDGAARVKSLSPVSDQFFVTAQKRIHNIAHTIQTKMQKWLMKQVMPWKETKAIEKNTTHPDNAVDR